MPTSRLCRLFRDRNSRRTFATLLKGSGEDVKTTQELMRHANSRLTLDVYAQALTPAKRAAHLKVFPARPKFVNRYTRTLARRVSPRSGGVALERDELLPGKRGFRSTSSGESNEESG